MEVLVVAGEGLMRPAGRLAAALGDTHEAIVLSAKDYAISATPSREVGVLTLGTELVSPATLDDPAWAHHGIRWGTDENRAWLAVLPVDAPQAVLLALKDELDQHERAARLVREARGPLADPKNFGGADFAARFLNPRLKVPAQTVAAGGFSFSPDRMCWERQYTVGVADFLASGFDEWVASFAG